MRFPYDQKELALLGAIERPKLLPSAEISACKTYREAVRLCWLNRRIANMTHSTLAERSGCNPSHVGDYIDANERTSKGAKRRSLPSEYVSGFQAACGNYAITQWQVMQDDLHLLEEAMQKMAA